RNIYPYTSVEAAASMLGSGYQISAQDTVPFALWCAGQFLDNYAEALWQTASGLGDIDTTCAMVGGIVALYTGVEQIPEQWIERREALPTWVLKDEA
ncbi:MAG: ADP-ribosylglycohydrolase family protein, partial [Ktedonobacteraceae bacterium]